MVELVKVELPPELKRQCSLTESKPRRSKKKNRRQRQLRKERQNQAADDESEGDEEDSSEEEKSKKNAQNNGKGGKPNNNRIMWQRTRNKIIKTIEGGKPHPLYLVRCSSTKWTRTGFRFYSPRSHSHLPPLLLCVLFVMAHCNRRDRFAKFYGIYLRCYDNKWSPSSSVCKKFRLLFRLTASTSSSARIRSHHRWYGNSQH